MFGSQMFPNAMCLLTVVVCSSIPEVRFSKASLMSSDTSFNSTVVYTCLHGYIAETGSDYFNATCSSNGRWVFNDQHGTRCNGGYVMVRYVNLVHQITSSSKQVALNVLYLYIYSVQYLHVLQDSKHYVTYLTLQGQYNSQITDIPLSERQRLKDHHISTSFGFFNLPQDIGSNDRGLAF